MGDLLLRFLFIIVAIVFIPGVIFIFNCIRYYRIQPYLLYQFYADLEIKSHEKTIPHEEIFYRSADGVMISAWYVPVEVEEGQVADKVVLFCHGNAGNISQRVDSFKIFQSLGLNTFIFDYRGYGLSGGIPSEKGTYMDADGAWLYLVEVMKYKPENIILFGRSLGGGVSAYLAEKYAFRGWIIESSFTSVPDIAKRFFPFQPVNWLARYKYNTLKRIENVHCPVLVIHSPDDTLIPYSHGKKLFKTANQPKMFLRIRGKHIYGFIESGSIYVDGLKAFIEGLDEAPPALELKAEGDIKGDEIGIK